MILRPFIGANISLIINFVSSVEKMMRRTRNPDQGTWLTMNPSHQAFISSLTLENAAMISASDPVALAWGPNFGRIGPNDQKKVGLFL